MVNYTIGRRIGRSRQPHSTILLVPHESGIIPIVAVCSAVDAVHLCVLPISDGIPRLCPTVIIKENPLWLTVSELLPVGMFAVLQRS